MPTSPEQTADVIILGAGVIGLQIAHALRRTGREILLLERGQPAQQASWASAGIVTDLFPSADDPLSQLRHIAIRAYPQLAAELRESVGLDVEYRTNGAIEVAFNEQQAARLAEDVRRERAAGQDTEFVEGSALRSAEPGLSEIIIAARLAPGGQVEPRRLCRALELAVRQAGVRVRTGVPATELLVSGERVSGVQTLEGVFYAPLVINCLGAWSAQLAGCRPSIPVVPQRGQILALRPPRPPIQRVLLREDDPYLVPRADGRLIVGATRELVGYDPSLTADGIAWLLDAAMAMVPSLKGAPIHEMWTGFRPLSLDGLPIIGPGEIEGLLFATGHGPSGITLAPGTVEVIVALVEGRPSPVPLEAFSPLRFRGSRPETWYAPSARPIPGHDWLGHPDRG